MYGYDEFWENCDLSPIESLISNFRDECVKLLMNDVKSDINSIIENQNHLIKENNEYKAQIADLEKQINTDIEKNKESNLFSLFSDKILEKYNNCNTVDERNKIIFDFCNLLFETDVPIGAGDKIKCSLWIILSVQYLNHKEEIIQILDYFNILYPDNLNTLKLPNEWNETELDMFFANMPWNYVCNGAIYHDNLQYWYRNALKTIKEQLSQSYSEIPWQLLLRNPLLHDEKYLKLIGENMFGNQANWIYFEKLTDYQEYSDEEILTLIKSINIDLIAENKHNIKKIFIKFLTPYIHLIDDKKILDKYFQYLCEQDYQIKYESILLKMPLEYIKIWLSQQTPKICLEYITRFEKELIELFGTDILKELLSLSVNNISKKE